MTHRLALALLLALPLAPAAAAAHALLVESTPPAGSVVAAGHARLRLRFNSRLDKARSRLTLAPAGGEAAVLPIAPDGPPNVLAAEAELPPGPAVLRWQVLAEDGHITRGDVPFRAEAGPLPASAEATPAR